MAISDSVIGEALLALFPTKRYAPKRDQDTGCPPPPKDEEEVK